MDTDRTSIDEGRRLGLIRLLVEQAATARDVRDRPGGPEKWKGFMAKKGFPQVADPALGDEFMWVEVTGTRGGRLVGRLANRPCLATYLSAGEEIELTEDEVFGAEWPVDR